MRFRSPTVAASCVLPLAAMLASGAVPAQAAGQPTIEEFHWLGWPDAVQSVSEVVTNDLGQTALTASTDIWTTRAYYLLQDGGWGALPAWENAAAAINAEGVVCGWLTNGDDHPTTAYTWDPVLGTFVLDQGLPEGTTGSRAADIRNDGTIVGRVFVEQGGQTTAWPFRTGDGVEVLFGSVENGEPMAVNEHGTMVVRAWEGDRNAVYLIDADGAVTPLPASPWELINPLDINDRGHVVGDAETADLSVDEAFAWDGEQYVLLTGPDGFTSADAEAVNDLDQIAGWGWNGGFEALVWQGGQAYSLEALVSEHLGSAVTLNKAHSITDEGWVAGWGNNPATGELAIFRVKLGPPCPDPATGEGMVSWLGGAGQYDDPDRWSGGEVPGADAIVRFGAGGGTTVDFASDVTNTAALIVGEGGGALLDLGDRTWTLEGGESCLPSLLTHTQGGELALHDLAGGRLIAAGGASLEHGGAVMSVYGGQEWQVAGGPLLVGHPDTVCVAFGEGSAVEVAQEAVLGLRTGEHARVDLDAADLQAGRLVVGSRGTGRLDLDEASASAPVMILGEIADGSGSIVAAGAAGNVLAVGESLVVAEAGTGRLELSTTIASVGDLVVGDLAGSDGLVSLGAGSTSLLSSGVIGGDGQGRVEVSGGAEFVQSEGSSVVLGAFPGGDGVLLATGTDAAVSCVQLTVGVAGRGSVQLLDTAELDVEQSIILGDLPEGVGELQVTGAQVTAAALYVGDEGGGTGLVQIDELGVVLVDELVVGPGGTLIGDVIELGLPGGGMRRAARTTAVRTTALRLAAGSTVDVDSVTFGDDWILGGTATLPFGVTNDAVVEPGGAAGAGTLRLGGDYAQLAAGALRIDVFGPGPGKRAGVADALQVDGAAALAGTLSVRLAADADPEVDDRHRILTAASVSGRFDALVVPPEIEGELAYGADWVDLLVTSVSTPVEVPALTGRRDGNAVVLGWRAAPGVDADRFVVHHAAPGDGWRRLAEVPAGSSGSYEYRFGDLLGGEHRFRVEQWAAGEPLAVSRTIALDLPAGPSFAMTPVVPNPFNPRATLSLTVAASQHVRVCVLDLRGRVVATLHDGALAGGAPHVFQLDGSHWPSGVYLVHATGERFAASRKVMLLE